MRWLDRLAGKREFRTSTLANPDQYLLDAFSGGTMSYSGQKVSLDKALTLTPFRAGVQLISETVGMLPLKVYREDELGQKQPARAHRTWRMLHDRPNPETDAHRFWSTVATHLLIWGNAYIEKLRDQNGLVAELWLRDPAEVQIEWDDRLKRRRFYEDGQNGRRYWDSESMLHVCGWSTNGLAGDSLLWRGRQTLGNALAREEFEGSFYKRGAILANVIEHPGRLGETGAKRLRDYFSTFYGGSSRSFGTPVLEEGAKLHTVGNNLVDLDFEAAQQRSRTEIAVMLRLPPAFLAGTTGDSLTYATVESNMIQYVQHSVAPTTNTIQTALAADPGLFPFPSWFPEFVLEGLLKADSKARADFYKIMNAVGAITSNEIRARENMPPLEGGDEINPAGPPPLEAGDPIDETAAV